MPRVSITVPEKHVQPYRFQLERDVITIGRNSECDIIIESGSVSSTHAEMRRTPTGYELVDTGSTNGITLDDVLQKVIHLKNGAAVKVGDVSFDFQLSEEEVAEIARENLAPQAAKTPNSEGFPTAVKPVAPTVTYVEERSGGGPLVALVFLILAIAAFFGGLAVRFEKETGGNLMEAIKARSSSPAAPTK
jgi:pSer/pThr/pTyr-binding forkhead associated (FHA) protein